MVTAIVSCPVCEGRVRRLGRVAPAHRSGHDAHDILECCGCGLSYSDPSPSPASVDAFYAAPDAYDSEYGQQDFAWQRAQHERDLRRVMRRRPPPARLLDVGCSYGLALEVAQGLGYDPFGVEPNPIAVRAARRRIGDDRVVEGVLTSVPHGWTDFDVISMSHVFEHFVDFRAALSAAASLLAPGGVLSIQAPNRKCWHTVRRGPDYRPIEHRITGPTARS